ncbi:MAG: 3-phosphoshikimate 1-carboxyvinyltransferase [Gemmatimonadota bacterium]|nr:3-phosphoshikimate 1-carboxyvinyltransferase [Gemmatimonadota bacterium]
MSAPELRFRPPGDKSISHRALILAALAAGPSRLRGLPGSADVAATRRALAALGARFEDGEAGEVVVRAPTDWSRNGPEIDCGNSGTTARLMLGVLTGLGIPATLTGDASLSRRPMDRVVYPLQAMGGRLRYAGDRDRLPVVALPRASGSLRVLRYRSRVASAQVKSAVLLAGLAAGVEVEVHEPAPTRDHTERLLAGLGLDVEMDRPEDGGARVRLAARDRAAPLPGLDFEVPGDVSSAAFLSGAALLSGRSVRVEGVGLNPGRTAWLERLGAMGVAAETRVEEERLGEPVGTLRIRPGRPGALRLGPAEAAGCIDEVPLLAILAARAEGESRIDGVAELRVKESDRLALLAANLRALGGECEERPDGLTIHGTDRPLRGRVRTDGDHRIAMAFAVLGLAPGCRVEVDDPDCVAVSYPGFWDDLRRFEGDAT